LVAFPCRTPPFLPKPSPIKVRQSCSSKSLSSLSSTSCPGQVRQEIVSTYANQASIEVYLLLFMYEKGYKESIANVRGNSTTPKIILPPSFVTAVSHATPHFQTISFGCSAGLPPGVRYPVSPSGTAIPMVLSLRESSLVCTVHSIFFTMP
jgi:hypothetical protein